MNLLIIEFVVTIVTLYTLLMFNLRLELIELVGDVFTFGLVISLCYY